MQHIAKIFAGLLLALAVAAQLGGGLASTVQATSHTFDLRAPGSKPPGNIPGIGIDPTQNSPTVRIGPNLSPRNLAQNIAILFSEALRWASAVFFSFAIVMILWAGVQFIWNAEKEDKIKEARKRLGWGLIGLTIGLLAYALPGIITQLLSGALVDVTGGSATVNVVPGTQ